MFCSALAVLLHSFILFHTKIMKKLLILLLSLLACISSYAQLAQNQRVVGNNYYTDVLPSEGSEIDGAKNFMLLTAVPSECFAKVAQGNVVGVRFGLNASIGATTVHVMPAFVGADGNLQVAFTNEQHLELPVAETKAGWNYAMLDEEIPVEFYQDFDFVFVGYDYTSTDDGSYPLCVNSEENMLGFVTIVNGGWGDDYHGTLCVQFVVEGDFPGVDLVANHIILDKYSMVIGKSGDILVNMHNYGQTNASNVELQVSIDGIKTEVLKQKTVKITPSDYYFTINIPADLTPGVHNLAVKTVSAGGEALTAGTEDDEVKTTFTAIKQSDIVERDKYLIEQFTSTYCTWCPNGSEFLKSVQELVPSATVVAVHGNMSAQQVDPYNNDDTSAILRRYGVVSFPGAAVNRIALSDGSFNWAISYDDGREDQHVKQVAEYLKSSSELCIAPISAEATLSADGKQITVNVSGEGSDHLRDILEDCAVTVYVVENGLVSLQYYPGAYEPKYVHNNVLRKIASSPSGDKLRFPDDNAYERSYSVDVPAEWNTKNLEVVAFITRRSENPFNSGVINATRVAVVDPTGVESVELNAASAPVYDLSGRAASANAHGVFIQQGKKVIR